MILESGSQRGNAVYATSATPTCRYLNHLLKNKQPLKRNKKEQLIEGLLVYIPESRLFRHGIDMGVGVDMFLCLSN